MSTHFQLAMAPVPQGIQRRRLARVPCAFPAQVAGMSGVHEGTATNFSLGGVFVAGAAVPCGESVRVTLSIEPGPVEVEGESLGSRALPNPGCAIRFTRLSPQALTALASTLTALR